MQQCLNRYSDMCHTRLTIKIDALRNIINNGIVPKKDIKVFRSLIVLQSTWDDAKDVDRARYGDEGKHSRRFASYEHIPLPVRIMLRELLLKHADNLS